MEATIALYDVEGLKADMGVVKYIFLWNFLLIGAGNFCFGQTRQDRLYTMSAIGFSFPIGETSNYFKPKVSTELGFNIGLGKAHIFLYPQLSFQAYSLNQLYATDGYSYTLHKARATSYLLNLAFGYRKIINKIAWYGFLGGGGGIILTPQVTVDNVEKKAVLSRKSHKMPTIEAGAGFEYNLGGVAVFMEASYLSGSKKIEARRFNSIPLFIGIKPNLDKILKKTQL